jgi:hypothetical protein
LTCVGIDRFWLKRWIARNEYIDPRIVINVEVLDDLVHDFSLMHPQRGERMVIGYLRSKGIRASRKEVDVNIHHTI